MNPERVTKYISIISVILVLALALGAFVLSYFALFEVAVDYGIAPAFAWIWPLLVDGAIVVFALAVVRASLLRENTRWLWVMVISFTAATIFFNILHSVSGLVSGLVALIAPAALVLSFETLMSNLRNHVERSGIIHSMAELRQEMAKKQQELSQTIADKEAKTDNLNRQIKTLQDKITGYNQNIESKKAELNQLETKPIQVYLPDNLTIEQRQQVVRLMDNDHYKNGQIAEALGVSEGTVKNDKRAMKETMNGEYSGEEIIS